MTPETKALIEDLARGHKHLVSHFSNLVDGLSLDDDTSETVHELVRNALTTQLHSALVTLDGGSELSDDHQIAVVVNGSELPDSLHEYIMSAIERQKLPNKTVE